MWSNLIILFIFTKELNMTFIHMRYLKAPRCVPADGSTSVQHDNAEDVFQIVMADNVAAKTGHL